MSPPGRVTPPAATLGAVEMPQFIHARGTLRCFVVAKPPREPRKAHRETGVGSRPAPPRRVQRRQGQASPDDLEHHLGLKPHVGLDL